MSKSTELHDKIEATRNEIRQLENRQKMLLQKEKVEVRKARTRRLIQRGAILESLIDEADTLTNEQIKTVLIAALGSGPALESLASAQGQQDAEPMPETGTAQGARP